MGGRCGGGGGQGWLLALQGQDTQQRAGVATGTFIQNSTDAQLKLYLLLISWSTTCTSMLFNGRGHIGAGGRGYIGAGQHAAVQ